VYDVFCYGAISLDVSGRLERPLHVYGQATATDYGLSIGGDAALVSLTLAGLGLEVGLAGSPIGDDPMGEYILKTLKKESVQALMARAGKTAITAIVIDRDKRSTITFHENTPETDIQVPDKAIINSKYVYVDGCFRRNSAIVGKLARDNGVKSILNLDRPAIPNIEYFDIVIAGEEASKYISPDPAEAARKIHEIDQGIGIVTLGEKGCVCCDGNLLRIPAFVVEAVDTTGTGAAFAAAYIYAMLGGEPLDEALRFASAAGAYKAMFRGSYRKFTKQDILDLMAGA